MEIEVLNTYYRDKQVPEQIRSYLSSLPAEDLKAVVNLVKSLSPSSNTLRSYVDLLGDIRHRDKINFAQILEKLSLSTILSSSGSSKDKQVKLKNSLLRFRYPEKFTIEDTLNQLCSEVKDLYGVRLILPEELEGDQLQINISFRSKENLATYSEKLTNLSESKQLQKIFSILKGEN